MNQLEIEGGSVIVNETVSEPDIIETRHSTHRPSVLSHFSLRRIRPDDTFLMDRYDKIMIFFACGLVVGTIVLVAIFVS